MEVARKHAAVDGHTNPPQHVVARLQRQLSRARTMGLRVRMELLADEQATWCEIAGVPTLFVDLSQTAGEQLRQVTETLDAYENEGQVAAARRTESFNPRASKHAA